VQPLGILITYSSLRNYLHGLQAHGMCNKPIKRHQLSKELSASNSSIGQFMYKVPLLYPRPTQKDLNFDVYLIMYGIIDNKQGSKFDVLQN
jgi:hypothetical protein